MINKNYLELVKELPGKYNLYKCNYNNCGKIVEKNKRGVCKNKIKSCGCLKLNAQINIGLFKTTHHMTNSKEYKVWESMKARCYNKNNKEYPNYGGRGIIVCKEWINSFENFYKDMGPKPEKEYSLDRIDNNKNYYKENCRWATKKEQARNRRSNAYIKYNEIIKSLAEWSEDLNIDQATLSYRLCHGWSIQKAFTTPVRKRKDNL